MTNMPDVARRLEQRISSRHGFLTNCIYAVSRSERFDARRASLSFELVVAGITCGSACWLFGPRSGERGYLSGSDWQIA